VSGVPEYVLTEDLACCLDDFEDEEERFFLKALSAEARIEKLWRKVLGLLVLLVQKYKY
jgi:hypothetical protein